MWMSSLTPFDTMHPIPQLGQEAPELLLREAQAVLVVDMVESVRLMQRHEDAVIRRWRAFLQQARQQVLGTHGGRWVKSLGDGLLLSFPAVPQAVAASFELHRLAAALPALDDGDSILLRQGLNWCEVLVTEEDIYGAGVNLAARLAALAQPGQTVAARAAADQVVDGVHADLQDLGELYLKHLNGTVRACRLSPVGQGPSLIRRLPPDPQGRPRLLVLADPTSADAAGARVLAHALGTAAARMPNWRVVNPLSAARWPTLPGGQAGPNDAAAAPVDVVLQVQVRGAAPGDVRLHAITEPGGAEVWRAHPREPAAHWIGPDAATAHQLLHGLAQALQIRAMAFARQTSPHTLPAYQLMLAATNLLHRTTHAEARQAADLIEHLIERHPRSADARYWQAKWHFLCVVQHWTDDIPTTSARMAAALDQALGLDDDHAASWVLRSHLKGLTGHDPQAAQAELQVATTRYPNEPFGWLFLSGAQSFLDQGAPAADAAEQAWALSPVDPMDFFFLAFEAQALVAAGRYAQACARAERSARIHASHLPSLSTLMIAQVLDGRTDDARRTARHYLRLRPQASVSQFLRHHPAADGASARRDARALQEAGIPLN